MEAGPLLVTLGAVLLLVSLFLSWYTGEITAWEAFEVWDLVLFVLALASIAAGMGLTTQDVDLVDRRFLPVGVGGGRDDRRVADHRPAAGRGRAGSRHGRLAGARRALVMCLGAVLTFGRVHLALTVEGRDQRRHVSAVDARGPRTRRPSARAGAPSDRQRLFARALGPPATPASPSRSRPSPETTPMRPKRGEGKLPRRRSRIDAACARSPSSSSASSGPMSGSRSPGAGRGWPGAG